MKSLIDRRIADPENGYPESEAMFPNEAEWRADKMKNDVPMVKLEVVGGAEALAKNNLVVEASEMGLPPGVWPEFVVILTDEMVEACDGLLFERVRVLKTGSPEEPEVAGVEYEYNDTKLTILND